MSARFSCNETRILWMEDVRETKAIPRRCSAKKALSKNSQNSQENTCVGVSFFNSVTDMRSKIF